MVGIPSKWLAGCSFGGWHLPRCFVVMGEESSVHEID